MQRFWSTLALVVVLGGLVGYIYFVDAEREPSGSVTRERVFDSVEADAIEEVQIKSAAGETTRLQKSEGAWQLVEPVKAAADTSELSTITSSLASLEEQRVVEEDAADLAQYGLDPARIEVAFRPQGTTELRRLHIGEKTPTGGDLYARVAGEKRVFLVSSYLDSTFNKDTFSLRDRRMLVFDRNTVDGLELASGGSTIRLTKSGTEWRVASPISVRADYAAAEGVLERLSSTQMQGIVDQDATDLAKYGLTKPTGTITVHTGSSSASLTLGATENALLFAKDSSRPMVFTVAPILKDDVFKDVADFRRKDLFDGRAFTATRGEFTRGGTTIVLEKVKGEGEGQADVWRAGGEDVDSTKADDLLTKLTGLRAASFDDQAHASLKSPALVVKLRFDENKEETVTFGRSGGDVFASRSDEPGTARVEAATGLDDVMKALDELM